MLVLAPSDQVYHLTTGKDEKWWRREN